MALNAIFIFVFCFFSDTKKFKRRGCTPLQGKDVPLARSEYLGGLTDRLSNEGSLVARIESGDGPYELMKCPILSNRLSCD